MEIKKKEFTFKGKTLEELKTLEVREFAKLITSRQRRTILRSFQVLENFMSRAKIKDGKKKHIKTHDRSLVVIPEMVGMRIHIYNGQQFIPIIILPEMLGHRFGEFSPTRKKAGHSKATANKKKGPIRK